MKPKPIALLSFLMPFVASTGHAAPIFVDAGYIATPSTNIPAYEDTGGGELTDGDVGSTVWPGSPVPAPLVGWQNIDATATFNFAAPVNIGMITAWFADSDGSAGVSVPESIRVTTTDGFDQLFVVPNPDGSGTTVPIELGGFDITTTNVTLEIARNTATDNGACCGGFYEWVMMSEVQFFTPADGSPELVAPRSIDLIVSADPAVASAQFEIANVGSATSDLTIEGITITGPDAAAFTVGTFPASLAPGAMGFVNLTFDSGGVPGTYSARVELATNDTASPALVPIAVQVRGALPAPTAYQQAVLNLDPLLYWTFDESGDTAVARSLVNDFPENELVPQGGATRTDSTVTAGGAGLGRAASFDGAVGTMFSAADLFGDPTPGVNNNSPGFDFIATQIWAVEFWFSIADLPNQYFSEAFDGGGLSNNPGIIYNFNPGQLELFSGGRTGPTGVTPNTWHHLVAAFYGNSNGFGDNLREIHVDGLLFQSTDDAFSAGHGLRDIAIGNALNGTVPVTGTIDEYAIYELGNLPDLDARRARVAEIVEHFGFSADSAGFRITEVALLPGNRISLTWASKPGTRYSIFWAPDLLGFTEEVVDSIGSDGSETTFEFDNPSVDFDNPSGLPTVFFIVSEDA